MKASVFVVLVVVLVANSSRADFGGTIRADTAASPDGNVMVRVVRDDADKAPKELPSHVFRFYEFDSDKDTFLKRSEFRFRDPLAHLMFVSNKGDLVLIQLTEKQSVRLLTKDGKLVKSWDLSDILSATEIDACAKTGATLQWLDEGAFFDRDFYLRGPSQRIRALQSPFTVIRGADPKVLFSGTIDAQTGEFHMNKVE